MRRIFFILTACLCIVVHSNGYPSPAKYIGMVYVEPGEFVMGSADGFEYERPRNILHLKGFYIDKYEVTNKQYKIFIDAIGHPAPLHWRKAVYPSGQDNFPVVNVSYYDAEKYARWTGKRLPTEQEWEKAARGNDGRIYPWGNDWKNKVANVKPTLGLWSGPLVIGSYPGGASPSGCFDMAGNVWEWTSSWFAPYPGNILLEKFSTVFRGQKYKILRGGSFKTTRSMSQSFRREVLEPDKFQNDAGFRCVKDW